MNKIKTGRPKKARTGKQVWIPAECLDVVNAVVEAMKKPKTKTEQQVQP